MFEFGPRNFKIRIRDWVGGWGGGGGYVIVGAAACFKPLVSSRSRVFSSLTPGKYSASKV